MTIASRNEAGVNGYGPRLDVGKFTHNVIYSVNYSVNYTTFFSSRKKVRISEFQGSPKISHRPGSQIRNGSVCVRHSAPVLVSVTWWAARQSLCVSSRVVGASSGSLSRAPRANCFFSERPQHSLFGHFQNSRYSVVFGACYRKPSSKSKSPSAENVIYLVIY